MSSGYLDIIEDISLSSYTAGKNFDICLTNGKVSSSTTKTGRERIHVFHLILETE
jgi:hypothetical protein